MRHYYRLLYKGVNCVVVTIEGLEEPDADIIILDFDPFNKPDDVEQPILTITLTENDEHGEATEGTTHIVSKIKRSHLDIGNPNQRAIYFNR